MRIGFDMDDVICDTHGALVVWANGLFGPKSASRNDPIKAHLSSDAQMQMKSMLDQGDFFGQLAPKIGAVETLQWLYTQHECFIVTAAMEHPGSLTPKLEWIARHLPFWDPLRVVFCGEKHVVDVDWLVDDSPHHFERLRGRGLLFSAPKNRSEDRYPRADNWADVSAHFAL